MGLALARAQETSLDDGQGRGVEGDQEKPHPILRGRPWTVPVGGVPAGRTRLPSKAPFGHMGLERGLNGRPPRLKRLDWQAGHIQQACRASREIGEPSRAPGGGRLISGSTGDHTSR